MSGVYGQSSNNTDKSDSMATTGHARNQDAIRPFLPLKRKMLDQCTGDSRISEFPHSKQFISEEMMTSHLEQLQLSSLTQPPPSSSSGGVDQDFNIFPRQLNIKAVSSCPHSLECHVGRKRYLECQSDEEGEEEEYDIDWDSSEDTATTSTHDEGSGFRTTPTRLYKRIRLSPDSKLQNRNFSSLYVGNENRTKSVSRFRQNYNQIDDAIIGVSDLSSIPEEYELPSSGGDRCEGSEICTLNRMDDDGGGVDKYPSISLPLPLQSFPAPPLPSLFTGDHTQSCSMWMAPELLSATTTQNNILPESIIRELQSFSMQLVPWVDPGHFLQELSENPKDELKEEELLTD